MVDTLRDGRSTGRAKAPKGRPGEWDGFIYIVYYDVARRITKRTSNLRDRGDPGMERVHRGAFIRGKPSAGLHLDKADGWTQRQCRRGLAIAP